MLAINSQSHLSVHYYPLYLLFHLLVTPVSFAHHTNVMLHLLYTLACMGNIFDAVQNLW